MSDVDADRSKGQFYAYYISLYPPLKYLLLPYNLHYVKLEIRFNKVQQNFAQNFVQHIFALMEVNTAVEKLLSSKAFKEKAKEKNKDGGKLRMFVTRYQRGEVTTGTAVTLLERFGYEIDIRTSSKTEK